MCCWIHIFLNIIRLAFFRRLILPYLMILYYLTLAGIIIFPLCPGLLVQICAFSSVTGNKAKKVPKVTKWYPSLPSEYFGFMRTHSLVLPVASNKSMKNMNASPCICMKKRLFQQLCNHVHTVISYKKCFYFISFKAYLIHKEKIPHTGDKESLDRCV